MRHVLSLARTLLIAAVGLAGTAVLAATAPAGAASGHASPTYYVSVGDSYSVGYQPGLGATSGYTGYVAKRTHLTLVNFGCGGATTTSLIDTVGCPDILPHTGGGMAYPATTQAAAAEAFITAHRGHIGLITVSIGGNDVTSCASQANPIPCVGTAVTNITTNVTTLATALRAAAGPRVPIIGLTYPDVILGDYLATNTATKSLAPLSVNAFQSLINPALQQQYQAIGATFVDVTSATGAYTPFTQTTSLSGYGTVPIAVARVCELTFFCQYGDIHPRTVGYTEIATLIAAALPKR